MGSPANDDAAMYSEIETAQALCANNNFVGDKRLAELAEAQVHATIAVAYAISTLAFTVSDLSG